MMKFPLASISLAAPVMLAGLALLMLPVIAHLLQAKLRKVMVFPSLRFMSEAPQGQRKLKRFREYLLLFLRALCLLALIFAFAQPEWWKSDAAAQADGEASTLFLVDLTPSMRQQQHGRSQLDEAKSALRRMLRDLEAQGDLAMILPFGGAEELKQGSFTNQYAQLRRQVDELECGWARVAPESSFRNAVARLRKQGGPGRLVLISDFQASNWPASLGQELPAQIECQRIDLSRIPVSNLSLQQGQISPALPAVGSPCRISVELVNEGNTARQLNLELFEGETRLGQQRLQLPPRSISRQQMELSLEREGLHHFHFRIPEDGLEFDNEYHVLVDAGRLPEIALVTDEDPQRPGSSAYYVTRAMSPSSGQNDRYRVRRYRGRDLEQGIPAELHSLVISGVAQLSPAACESLAQYLEQGGQLMLFCAEAAFRETALALEASRPGLFLPWQPRQLQQVELDEAFYFGSLKRDSTSLDAFTPEVESSFPSIPMLRRWSTTGLHAEARNLMSYTDGVSALSSRSLASGGRVILFNATPDAAYSDLGRSGFFVALLHALLERPSSQSALQELHPGQTLEVTATLDSSQPPRDVRVLDPSGKPMFRAEFLLQGAQLRARVPEVQLPGVYELWAGDNRLAAAAVHVDPRESRLASLSDEQRQALLPSGSMEGQAYATQDAAEAMLEARQLPLWGWFVLLGILGFSIESFWLGWGRR